MTTFQIGDVRLTRVVEMESPTRGDFLYERATREAILSHAWLRPRFASDDGKLKLCIQAFVIETAGQRIVVDTCVGNDKVRSNPLWNKRQGRFLEELAEAGFPPDSIDRVLCTHLHVDHVGWNTRWTGSAWVPTFENARYLIGRAEWAHWVQEKDTEEADVVADSVQPVVDAGLVDLVESDHRLSDEVALEPTPGHTPGHVSVRIRSKGEEAVITGDLIHHPIQCSELDWASRFDVDPDQARETRRTFLARCADEGTRVFGTHFATPSVGRFVRVDDAFRFESEIDGDA